MEKWLKLKGAMGNKGWITLVYIVFTFLTEASFSYKISFPYFSNKFFLFIFYLNFYSILFFNCFLVVFYSLFIYTLIEVGLCVNVTNVPF